MIVVGEQGVKIIPQERPREGIDIFQFMSSASSSESAPQHIARKVASDIYNTRKEGGKIIVVSGPVLVHSGAVEALASLIRMGYVDGLLAGNALAVHDVENALLSTHLACVSRTAHLRSEDTATICRPSMRFSKLEDSRHWLKNS